MIGILISLGCFLIFLFLIALMPKEHIFFWAMVLGFILAIGEYLLLRWWFVFRVQRRNKGALAVFRRMLEGDLAIPLETLQRFTHSRTLSRGIIYLLEGIIRIIKRFQKASRHAFQASEDLLQLSQVLAHQSQNTETSMESTFQSTEEMLAKQIDVHDSIERLSANTEETASSILQMNASIEEVSDLIATMQKKVDQVSDHIGAFNTALTSFEELFEQLGSFAYETSSSTQELQATADEVHQYSQTVSKKAHESRELAQEGKSALEALVSSVSTTKEDLQKAYDTTQTLAKEVAAVSEVTQVIEDIVRQTNMLSLNASIIAAKAKEHGKSFGVIAQEIHELAERTALSTEEIRTIVTNVQKASHQVSMMVQSSFQRMDQSVGKAQEVNQRLETILRDISSTLEAIEGVAKMTSQQYQSSQQIAQAVEEVNARIQKISPMVEQHAHRARQTKENFTEFSDSFKHILKSIKEQKAGSSVIQGAVENIRRHIEELVKVSQFVTQATQQMHEAMKALQGFSSETLMMAQRLHSTADQVYEHATFVKSLGEVFKTMPPRQGGTLKVFLPWRYESPMDPLFTSYMQTSQVTQHIYETLFTYAQTPLPDPLLVETYFEDHEGRRITLTLKKDVFFHNGQPLTSKDVVYTFMRALHPQSPSHAKHLFTFLEGAPEYISGGKDILTGIREVDKYTVEFRLRSPSPIFFALLSLSDFSIVPAQPRLLPLQPMEKPIGTGPYRLENLSQKEIVLKKHRHYHHPEEPYLEEIHLFLEPQSKIEAFRHFLDHQADLSLQVPLAQLSDELLARLFFQSIPIPRTSFVVFNHRFEPLKNKKVRQALNFGVNKERMNRLLFGEMGMVAASILPPSLSRDRHLLPYPYNPEKAKALLREAGFPHGLTLEMWIREEEAIEDTPIPLLKEDLATIGVHLRLTPLPAQEIAHRRQKNQLSHLFFTGWVADFPDPDNFFSSLFLPEVDGLTMGYENSEVANLILRAKSTLNRKDRWEIYQKLNRIIHEEAPVLFLFHLPEVVCYHHNLRGVEGMLVPPIIRFQKIWQFT